MTPLDKLRDELAKKCGNGTVCDLDEKDYFRAGFDAALRALDQHAGEFDVSSANSSSKELDMERFEVHAKRHGHASAHRNSYFLGARWQFEQMSGKIAWASYQMSLANARNIQIEGAEAHIKLMRENYKQLEARLAESSEKQLQLAFKFNAAVDRCLEVENKLATAKVALEKIAANDHMEEEKEYYAEGVARGALEELT